MIDGDLGREIGEKVEKTPGGSRLSDAQAAELLDALAERVLRDDSVTWWWTALAVPHQTISYGDGDGLDELARIVPLEARVLLVITDDEARPWPVFSGVASALLAVLRGVRFCEYFFVDPALSWLVFDTHHNQLVVTGSMLPTPASS